MSRTQAISAANETCLLQKSFSAIRCRRLIPPSQSLRQELQVPPILTITNRAGKLLSWCRRVPRSCTLQCKAKRCRSGTHLGRESAFPSAEQRELRRSTTHPSTRIHTRIALLAADTCDLKTGGSKHTAHLFVCPPPLLTQREEESAGRDPFKSTAIALCSTPCPDEHVPMSLHSGVGARAFSVDKGTVWVTICLLLFLGQIINIVCTEASAER